MVPQNSILVLTTPDLIENRENLSTWKGPYIDYTSKSTTIIKDKTTAQINSDAVFQLVFLPTSTWADNVTWTYCTAGSKDCSVYLALYGGTADGKTEIAALFTQLDEMIDNGDGALTGKLRYNQANFGYILYQAMPYVRQ